MHALSCISFEGVMILYLFITCPCLKCIAVKIDLCMKITDLKPKPTICEIGFKPECRHAARDMLPSQGHRFPRIEGFTPITENQ